MDMGEMIRKRRTALGMTQEQVAQRLGVTAPAVNKWERGVTCPDIGLLPALARLLETAACAAGHESGLRPVGGNDPGAQAAGCDGGP